VGRRKEKIRVVDRDKNRSLTEEKSAFENAVQDALLVKEVCVAKYSWSYETARALVGLPPGP
jgi:hypothetical protein